MFFWRRQAGVLLVLLLAIAVFPALRRTPVQLFQFSVQLWPQRDAVRQAWRTEHAGEASLPPRVRSMLTLLRQGGIQEFRYSAAIANDPDASVVQRIAESAYPIRIRQDARHLLLLTSEPLDPRCTLVATHAELALANCS